MIKTLKNRGIWSKAISVIPRPGVESVKMFYFNGINVAPSYTEVLRMLKDTLQIMSIKLRRYFA